MHPPKELATLAWSCAMLSEAHAELFRLLAKQASAQLADFSPEELLLLAWGSAGSAAGPGTWDPMLARAVQSEMLLRLGKADLRNLPGVSWRSFAKVVLGVLWAYSFRRCLSNSLLSSARATLMRKGMMLDAVAAGRGLPQTMTGLADSDTLVTGVDAPGKTSETSTQLAHSVLGPTVPLAQHYCTSSLGDRSLVR